MMQGSCLCGAVQFEVEPPLRDVVACHCSQCRKTSGHYWAASSVPLERFHLRESRGLRWFRSSDSAERGFCDCCGATLFWKPSLEPRIAFAAGALDAEPGLRLIAHIHKEDAGDYYRPEGPPCAVAAEVAQVQGSCLCGANRFTLPGPIGAVDACHCGQCRKTSGHYSASFDCNPDQIRWQAKLSREYRSPGGATRGFCPSCSASLWFCDAQGVFSLEAGLIDAPTGGWLRQHIFMADAAGYDQPDDGLPQHREWD